MPRLRHRRAVRRQFDDDHRCYVYKGMCFAGGEWSQFDCRPMRDIPPDVLDDMAEAWEQYRDELMDQVANDLRYWAGMRPWGFWAFDYVRDDSMTEAAQLTAMGMLFPGELEQLTPDRTSFWKPGEFDRGDAGETNNTTTHEDK